MAKVDLVRLIRHVGSEITWYWICLDKLWLNEHEHVRDAAGDRQRVIRTKLASSAVARRRYHAAIRAREANGFSEWAPITQPGPAINGKGQFAHWHVAGTKSWWARGKKWSANVEIVIIDTTAKPKAAKSKPANKPSRRRRS